MQLKNIILLILLSVLLVGCVNKPIDKCAKETCGNALCSQECNETFNTCAFDCEGPCNNAVCNNICSSNNLLTNGKCQTANGLCQYDTVNCAYGCNASINACNQKPADVCTICPNTCNGNNLLYNGVCLSTDASCHYTSVTCQYGCENNACKNTPPINNTNCGNHVCNADETSVTCPNDCYKPAPNGSLRANTASVTYTKKDIMINNFKSICNAAPTKCSYEVIGKTILNKDINLFKIGNPNGGKVMMDGLMHGWEDSGTELGYEFAKWLLTSNDIKAQQVLNNNYVLIIPIVNIDNVTRTNVRHIYPDGTQVLAGVDLNRNYCPGWTSLTGNSNPNVTKADYTHAYRGLYCESEPETQAVVYAIKTYKPDVYINFHLGGGPTWGRCGDTALGNNIITIYDRIRGEIGMTYRYPIGGACGSGQASAGANAYGVKSSWLTETQTTNLIPGTRQEFIDEFYPKNYPMLMAMMEATAK